MGERMSAQTHTLLESGRHLSCGCTVIDARTLEHILTCSAATASADCNPQQDTRSQS